MSFLSTDIGDAMLLGTLWRELFKLGVVLVTTSNSPPDELYRQWPATQQVFTNYRFITAVLSGVAAGSRSGLPPFKLLLIFVIINSCSMTTATG